MEPKSQIILGKKHSLPWSSLENILGQDNILPILLPWKTSKNNDSKQTIRKNESFRNHLIETLRRLEVKLRVFEEAIVLVDISLPALFPSSLCFLSLGSVECAFQSVPHPDKNRSARHIQLNSQICKTENRSSPGQIMKAGSYRFVKAVEENKPP